jgi:hypothetical protein
LTSFDQQKEQLDQHFHPSAGIFREVREVELRSAAGVKYDYKTRNRNEVVHGGNVIGDVYMIQKRSVRNAAICKTGFLRMYGIPSDDLQQLLPWIYWNVTKLHAGCRLTEKSLG